MPDLQIVQNANGTRTVVGTDSSGNTRRVLVHDSNSDAASIFNRATASAPSTQHRAVEVAAENNEANYRRNIFADTNREFASTRDAENIREERNSNNEITVRHIEMGDNITYVRDGLAGRTYVYDDGNLTNTFEWNQEMKDNFNDWSQRSGRTNQRGRR